ncbi:MAG: NADH dehydrogenase ubiquinone Fe-S protein 4, partial [Pseudomonadota bacterium]|nr:NADH dehydrogenase ubiquinone Fe-S protein 4 [Pseudomonadota bacterium]
MRARIYRPTKTAMQSGRSKAKNWVLEYEQAGARRPEPLMGWVAAAGLLSAVGAGRSGGCGLAASARCGYNGCPLP